ncbi:MAG TPA: CDP-alcohol phosphatidyltransferase family protein [Bryobacteraceae bacterium]|nr:CDP-alcohol phosphatidyltransferase family protein [Bryobacteraceae bacterium]
MFSVPNLFTSLRLLLAPVVIRAILHGQHNLALAVFAIAAATDGLDGAIARQFKQITTAGAYLDPIADKVLLSGVYLALAIAEMLPWWFVALIFGRDLLILSFAVYAISFTTLRKFEPSVWGKLSTFLQIVTAVTWMARNVLMHPAVDVVANALIWPTAAATVWSGLHYAWRGLRTLRTH